MWSEATPDRLDALRGVPGEQGEGLAAATAAFSAVSQGVGYGVAAAGPLIVGLLVSQGVGWPTAVASLAVIALLEIRFGIASSRASLVVQRAA